MTDPITDMLNRIGNAQAVLKERVSIPFSNLKYEIAKILEKEGFIEKVERKGRKTKKFFEIILKYQTSRSAPCNSSGIKQTSRAALLNSSGIKQTSRSAIEEKDISVEGIMKPAISGLKRISKPGQRIYARAKNIKPVQGGFGIAIISTPEGLMTNKEARKKKLGGEILCEIW